MTVKKKSAPGGTQICDEFIVPSRALGINGGVI